MNRLRARWSAVRASYWFVPAVMALLAIVLGAVMVWVDARLGSSFIEGVSWHQQVRADGAQSVLSTIAGSMVTVAGVVFSITIVALSYASSQYGPRVLTNFMSDRGNTITLGTFIATFLYCLMILRTIRGGDDDFVPQLSVIVALLLAVCSIGVLIYFIHHVLQSIHINNVVKRIGHQLVCDARDHFPELIEEGSPPPSRSCPPMDGPVETVTSVDIGYIQSIDLDGLFKLAEEAGVLIRLRYRPGDFVMEGRGLADVSPASNWTDEHGETLRGLFTVGEKRTPEHDLMFLVSELVEIAARALSPGVNDPVTAITCLDWLGAGGTELAMRQLPACVRCDDQGAPRTITAPDDFDHFVSRSFGRVRDYAAKDRMVSLHLLQVLGEVAAACRRPDQIDALRSEARHLSELAGVVLEGAGAQQVVDRAATLQQLLSRGVGHIAAAQPEWLGDRP